MYTCREDTGAVCIVRMKVNIKNTGTAFLGFLIRHSMGPENKVGLGGFRRL